MTLITYIRASTASDVQSTQLSQSSRIAATKPRNGNATPVRLRTW